MSRPPCICAARGVKCDESGCDLAPAGQPFDIARHCRAGWLYHHDPAYHELWAQAPSPPSLWGRATTFAGAVVTHVAGGMKHVSDEVYGHRLDICRSCERWRDGWCNKCGCRLAGDILAKARWEPSHCPLSPP